MNKYQKLANELIDAICDEVEIQHPELKLKTKYAKESDVKSPAVIVGVRYYNLEDEIARKLKEFKGA